MILLLVTRWIFGPEFARFQGGGSKEEVPRRSVLCPSLILNRREAAYLNKPDAAEGK